MLDGVPIAPLKVVNAPDEPTLTASAEATPDPRLAMLEIGRLVALERLTAEGVPRSGVVSAGDDARTMFPVPVEAWKDRFPEPSVWTRDEAEPSAEGRTKVTLEERDAADLSSV
jgi:hypothetical protein